MRELIDVEKVFHLACPNRETLFGRLKKRALKDNRLDDANEEVIQKRLDIYETESKPVLSYYPKDCITVVDAMPPPSKGLFDILASVNGAIESHAAVSKFHSTDSLLPKMPCDHARSRGADPNSAP